jgi:Tol biopolymer transport system component
LRSSPANPQVGGIRQLTDDGEGKDEFATIETDGSRVYFTEKYAGSFRLAQVAASGGQAAPVTTQIPAPYRASMAPDLSGLLVSENLIGRHPVWFQPLPAGDPRRLGNLQAQGAVFSPEGKQIFYTNGSSLYIADQDGANAHKIAELPGESYWPAVSPDGKKVRVTVLGENDTSLWEVGSDGNGVHRLPNLGADFSYVGYGRWTPDGRYFVFQRSGEGRTDVWAISEKLGYLSRSISIPTQLTNGPLSCSLPTPSRDGKQIFARCAKLRGELVRYDRKSEQFVPFLGGISATDVVYSRNGEWLVYLSYPDRSLWRMRADGRDRLRLTYPPMSAWAPHISPDGTKVAFAGAGPGSKHSIYIVGIAGGPLQRIVDEAADPLNPYWSPDGNSLAFEGRLPGMHRLEQNSSEIRVVDLASGNVSVIPQSRGRSWPVWTSQDTLVADTEDGSKLLRYDFKTQTWSDLAAGPFSDWDSTDGKYVYCATMEPAPPAAVRIRVSDGQIEQLADLTELRRIVTYGSKELSLTPDGELLFTRDIGTQEIYALNIRWP